MKTRPATIADANAIAALHTASWRSFYRGALSDAFLDGDSVADRTTVWSSRLLLTSSQQLVLVTQETDELIGFACAFLDGDPQWGTLVDNLHVAQSHHRQGVGASLLSAVLNWSRAKRPSIPVHLWVLQSNIRARAFYEAQGGSIVGTDSWDPPGGGSPVSRFRMAWTG
jgi:GNAT superfamily N-acetyltransferase